MTRLGTAGWIAGFALLTSLAGSAAATEEKATTAATGETATTLAEASEAGSVETPALAEAEEPMANGHVARAVFTTQVAAREPQDEVTQLGNDHTSILFFTDLRGLQGQTVTHVWERGGNVVAKVPFTVGAPRWRVYSSKHLEPGWTGEWGVKVVDETGQVIHVEYFEYVTTATTGTGTGTGTGTETGTAAAPASMPMD